MIEVCLGPHDVDDKFRGTIFPELCHIVNMIGRDKVIDPLPCNHPRMSSNVDAFVISYKRRAAFAPR